MITKWCSRRPSGARRSRSSTSTTGPTVTSRPVSSRTSRATASSSVSPSSTRPPGRLHSPLSGSWPRLTSRTRSPSKMTAPTPTIGRAGSPADTSLAHHFDDHAFLAPAVELRVEHLFPRAEIELAVGDRQHDLMSHDRPLQVRIGVIFSGLVMPVVEAGRRELFEPHLKILDQAVLPVIHVDSRRDVHRRDQRHAFLHRALLHDRRDIVRDADEPLALFRIEPKIFGEDFHRASAASALRSG